MPTKASRLVDRETERILIKAGFLLGLENVNHFPDAVIESTQTALHVASENMSHELALRRDLRSQCIFTIDPSTARDLDDALHCRVLDPKERDELAAQGYPEAVYEVSVQQNFFCYWIYMTEYTGSISELLFAADGLVISLVQSIFISRFYPFFYWVFPKLKIL